MRKSSIKILCVIGASSRASMNRREIKDQHESSVLKSFEGYLLENEKRLLIKERPDPPDALVIINEKATWIEITDAFFNHEFARSLTSYAANDMDHIPADGGLYIEPDASFEQNVQTVVSKKYQKNSLLNVYEKHGAGILLVGLYSPFAAVDEVKELVKVVSELKAQGDGRFNKIYMYDESHNFYPVP